MSESRSRIVATGALVVGALLGMAGTFAPATWRGPLRGLDGTALIVGAAFFAYPFLAATRIGGAWAHVRGSAAARS